MHVMCAIFVLFINLNARFVRKRCEMEDILFDPLDLSLLTELQRNGHATNQELGDRLHLSASQIGRRIQRLESIGVVRGYVALLDPAALALQVRAFTYVTLSRHGGEEGPAFEQGIVDFAEVLDCYSITGEADYVLQIVAASLSELSESVLKRIMRLPGVISVRSSLVLSRIKSTTELPLDHIGRGTGTVRRVRLV